MVESNRRDFLKMLGISAIAAAVPLPASIFEIIEETPVLTPDHITYDGLVFERNGVVTKLGKLYQLAIRQAYQERYQILGEDVSFVTRMPQQEPIELEIAATPDEAVAVCNIISSYHETNFMRPPGEQNDLRGTLYSELNHVGKRGNQKIRFQIGEVIFNSVETTILPPPKKDNPLAGYGGTPYRFDKNGKPLETLKVAASVYYKGVNWVEA